ncbi:MAG: GIY-YIG nuclease family protein [Deltaproteobacteria bacterium]|nr:GIY-YIG nuclease family protein [Deltaproteobacteria bacterium]
MKLIIHLLHDDQPTGPRVAKIDQWSGRALCLPRSALDEIPQEPALDGPCLYFLITQPPGCSPRVYVGEADGFRDRIKTHDAKKDWWSALVVFYSTDGSLTKASIQYLESVCVKRLRNAGWCHIENSTDPRLPSIPPEDVGGLNVFANNVEILMPVLGYDVFAKAPAEDAANTAPLEVEAPLSRERDFDTIVCPAHQDGFERAFLGQHAWWAIRIGEHNLQKIKYIAIYQVAPISAITHYGQVARIEPYIGNDAGAGKYKLYLGSDPTALPTPVGVGQNVYLKPQGPKYCKLDDILNAKTLDDIFGGA